jgi:hypothetical protein
VSNGSDTTTVNYGWVKPQVNGSDDTWGDKLNADLDAIDAEVHTVATQAGVKEAPIDGQLYVRNGQTASWAVAPTPALTAPPMDGTGAVGASALYARGDHVHPTDTSRYAASNPANYVNAAGAA